MSDLEKTLDTFYAEDYPHNNLAAIYLSGDKDVPANREKANKYFEIARKQGFLHTPVESDYLRVAGVNL